MPFPVIDVHRAGTTDRVDLLQAPDSAVPVMVFGNENSPFGRFDVNPLELSCFASSEPIGLAARYS